MKREEGSGEKKVVHGVQINAAHRGDDYHDEEEKQERHGSEKAYPAREWTGLQLLRHDYGDLISGNQIFVRPVQIPPIPVLVLIRWRKRIVGEVDFTKVRSHLQIEIFHLRHIFSKAVTPFIQTLRTISYR